ncbi:MAG: NUDIX domain-containing protein, partial [Bdellovibrionales bacterium]|nr:NUDIX domain-containing protein [Bdellovibrionales bacterium]
PCKPRKEGFLMKCSDVPSFASQLRKAIGFSHARRFDATELLEVCEVSFDVLDSPIPSSLLLLFYLRDGHLHFVATRRATCMRFAPGRMVLPGGHQESGEDAITGGLREGREEIAADVAPDEVVGALPAFYREEHVNFRITTVVALTTRPQHFVPNRREVDEIVELPVTQWLRTGGDASPFFPMNGAGETLMKGNAFAMEYLRQLLLLHR